jgi:hypothetical protein
MIKPALTEAQTTRLTEMAALAASDYTEIISDKIDLYLQQCYYPDVDDENLSEGYNNWVTAKFMGLFAEYLKNNLMDRAGRHMQDSVMFFEGKVCGQSACKNPKCGCNIPDHDHEFTPRPLHGGFIIACIHCGIEDKDLPDHDQRAEGLGDGRD